MKLDFDFAFLLTALTLITGVVWAADRLVFAKRRGDRKESWAVEYARSFFPVLAFVLILRSFLAEPFRIPSSSMMPTLETGDFILVNKFAYGLRLPVLNTKFFEVGEVERGDVIVFRYPVDPTQDYIKRVVGLPGDTVSFRNRQVLINGVPVPKVENGRYIGEGSGREMTGAMALTETLGELEHRILERDRGVNHDGQSWVVPPGHYFALGDNRDNSEDSRYWGFVPEANLVGRAFYIWMNWDGMSGGIDGSRIGTVIR